MRTLEPIWKIDSTSSDLVLVKRPGKISAVTQFARIGFPATIIAALLAACGGAGHHTAQSPATQAVPVDPRNASFGQPFRLGKLTIVVTDAGTLPDPSPGVAPRRRLVVKTENRSGVADRAPGLAVICEREPRLSGGSLYADPDPAPRPFVAGKPELSGTTDTASITVALAAACPRPALQVSTGGATINGLPRPVVIPM
jgi:hypothetical protein